MRSVEKPKTHRGPVTEAFERARAETEPLFVPANIYADDRGWSVMNQLRGVMSAKGQINYSVQYPGVVKAWHRHKLQTDFWMCVMGHIKVGVHRDEDDTSWRIVIGERHPGVLIIPPTLWHGAATVAHTPAGLLYYMTHPFNPDEPDEERRPHDAVQGFPWGIEHR